MTARPSVPCVTLRRRRVSFGLACLLALSACASTSGNGPAPDAAPADAAPAPDVTADVVPPPDVAADAALDAMSDATTRQCTSNGDCPTGTICQYAMGCDQRMGRCLDDGCQSLPVAPQYCGCDGRTIQRGSACLPDRAWRAMGPCPDGG